uniref:RING-type E3 ubiquitin transferase n=1 Tax=Periophthalmus magnuspinnatus TaxID=409849 RepID=A0A3B3ZDV5_9GOBI
RHIESDALPGSYCLCPICLEIFMEPVTLLCTHTFCKVCFLESVDKSTLCCPLCRKRVSTWVREHSRNNSLVNEALWERIQREFPQSAERRREEEHTGKRREEEHTGKRREEEHTGTLIGKK